MPDDSRTSPPREADLALIQRLIPHRYPFLMIDRVRDMVPFESAVGIKCVTVNEPHFAGHFPNEPIMPGVLIIEAMAQTAGVLAGVSLDLTDRQALVYFMGIDGARFRRKVVPGDLLELHVRATRSGVRVWKFEGRAMVGEELCADATYAAMIHLPAS